MSENETCVTRIPINNRAGGLVETVEQTLSLNHSDICRTDGESVKFLRVQLSIEQQAAVAYYLTKRLEPWMRNTAMGLETKSWKDTLDSLSVLAENTQ